jgi:hypothetical protein
VRRAFLLAALLACGSKDPPNATQQDLVALFDKNVGPPRALAKVRPHATRDELVANGLAEIGLDRTATFGFYNVWGFVEPRDGNVIVRIKFDRDVDAAAVLRAAWGPKNGAVDLPLWVDFERGWSAVVMPNATNDVIVGPVLATSDVGSHVAPPAFLGKLERGMPADAARKLDPRYELAAMFMRAERKIANDKLTGVTVSLIATREQLVALLTHAWGKPGPDGAWTDATTSWTAKITRDESFPQGWLTIDFR